MNKKMLAIFSMAILFGLSGAGNILLMTSKAESQYFEFEIVVGDVGDGSYEQAEEVFFDGDVYNVGDSYSGTYDCEMWITKGSGSGTFVETILDESYTGLDEDAQKDLDPESCQFFAGGWYRLWGKVTYNTLCEDTDSHLFWVQYL